MTSFAAVSLRNFGGIRQAPRGFVRSQLPETAPFGENVMAAAYWQRGKKCSGLAFTLTGPVSQRVKEIVEPE
jgi:hypothetical protein